MLLSELPTFGSFKTGYPSLDYYLDGVPRGRFFEFSGRESSYKTTLIQNIFGAIQKRNEVNSLFIDTEGNVDENYFTACGGDASKTEFFLNNVSEEVFQKAYDFIIANNKKDMPSVIAIDSLAGLTTQHELDKGVAKATMGDMPRILNRFLRIATIPIKENGSVVIFNNQLREDLSSQWGGTTTPGGRGIRHWSNYRVKLYDLSLSSAANKLEMGGEIIGQKIALNVDKHKNLVIHRGFTFEMWVVFGKGFSREMDLFTFGEQNGLISRSGAYYTFPNGEKFQGRNAVYEAMLNDPELTDSVYQEIMTLLAP